MKIKGEHYDYFRKLAEAGMGQLVAQGITQASYRSRDCRIQKIEAAKDVEMRFRWDCLWAGKAALDIQGQFPGDYAQAHIDTALKMIVAECAAKTPENGALQLDDDEQTEKRGQGR